MHRRLATTTCAAAIAAALCLSGCSPDDPTPATSGSSDPSSPTMTNALTAPPTTPLPSPDALTDVLTRLTDPNVAGADKVSLIEGATAESATTIDKFVNALRDNGYMPMTFTATNLAWSDKNPSDVMASIGVNNTRGNNGIFNFPMEFAPLQNGWQLSRRTAEMLLAMGTPGVGSSAPTPAEPPPAASPGPPR